MQMKICTGCGIKKQLEDFSIHSGFKDGRNSRCKMCKNVMQTEGYRSGKYKKPVYKPYTYQKQLRDRYGLSLLEYEKMVLECQGMCQICGRKEPLNVDHCHTTKKVRGLLCTRCNTGLGKFKDNIDILQSAIKYLESS